MRQEQFNLRKAEEARQREADKANKRRGTDQSSVVINLNDDDPDIPLEILQESIAMAK